MTGRRPPAAADLTRPLDHLRRLPGASVVGGIHLLAAGLHAGLVAADPGVYDGFADQALGDGVRTAWHDVFMAAPSAWGLALAAFELTAGLLLLAPPGPGAARRAGWAMVIAFQTLLLPFGWWAWVWAVPAAAVLVVLALADERRVPRPPRQRALTARLAEGPRTPAR